MSTTVVNCQNQTYDVYIGRHKDPLIGKWGNPFSHLEGTLAEFKVGSREEAIARYREWITTGEGKNLQEELHELRGKVLGCWCKPNKACHGDVLAELANTTQLF